MGERLRIVEAQRDELWDRIRQWEKAADVMERSIDKQASRIAELERQRDAVLALHRHRENHIVCVHDDEIWPCPTAAALGVREDERGQPIKPEPFAPEGETGQFIERGERG